MYYENPAFDWNHKTEKPSIEVNAIFSNFNLAVQYAPCIVFKNVLVCGDSIEVNCLSDLMVDLTTDELLLFHNLQNNLIYLQELVYPSRLYLYSSGGHNLHFQIDSKVTGVKYSYK